MNSTQTDTNSSDHTTVADPANTAAPTPPSPRKRYVTSELWLGVLQQAEWWVPRGSWVAYGEASIAPWGAVVANFDVDGVVRVADMDVRWRQSVTNFLWRKSLGITVGQSFGWLVGVARGPYEPLDSGGDDTYTTLARDAAKRRAWFDELPLIAHLRQSIIADRDARMSRPVLLEPAARTPHPSGLVLHG